MATGGRSGPGFWTGAVLGGAIVAFGLRGLLVHEPRGAASALRWLVGSALVLDLVLIPFVGAVAVAARRVAPGWAWPVLRAGLAVTGVLVLFAAPLVTDQGGQPTNPTVRPRDYGAGLAVAVVWTWAIAALCLLVRWRAGNRHAEVRS